MNAEQLRRAGNAQGAIDLCRDALVRFPGHLSARVTLGWALLDQGKLKEAREEFEVVRKSAPDNFAAIRGLAQLHVLEESHPEEYSFDEVDAEPAEDDHRDRQEPVLATLEGWLSRVQTLKAAV
jgi:tetratricopeptide (TPR) repeat protein